MDLKQKQKKDANNILYECKGEKKSRTFSKSLTREGDER